MGFFAKLFGSDKAIDKVSSAIDKSFYTDEEKSDTHMRLLQLYEPFKLAQRYLAIIFGTTYAVAWLIAFSLSCFNFDVTDQITLLKGDMADLVGVIFGFYFGGGAVEGVIRGVAAYRKQRNDDKK